MPVSSVDRDRSLLRMATTRLQILQKKARATAKQSRKDLAALMNDNRMESARIRAEMVITDDRRAEVLEALELYCELVLARAANLTSKNTAWSDDSRLAEAVAAIAFAASHVNVKELSQLRDRWLHMLDSDFITKAQKGESVPKKMQNNLFPPVPDEELVNAYLEEIMKVYGTSSKKEEEGVDASSSIDTAKAKTSPEDDLLSRFAALRK